VSAVDPILELGNSKEAKDAIFVFARMNLACQFAHRGYIVLS